MTGKLAKETNTQLRQLRAEWKEWRTCNLSHLPNWGIDFTLICPDECRQPGCEACAVTAYRADHLAELAAKATRLKEELAS